MLRVWLGLMAALVLNTSVSARLLAAAPPPTPDAALAEAQIISSDAEAIVGGWKKQWTADYAMRTTQDRVTTETPRCCVNVFAKGNALLVVKTEAVTRDAKGEPLTERVQRKLWVTRRPGEQIADCQIFWVATQLSLVDVKSSAVRSVVVDNGELVLFNWRDASGVCAYGD